MDEKLMAAPMEIGTPSPSTNVLTLELCAVTRPVGLLILLGQVPTLDPFRALPLDTRLWMRWAEPEETGLKGPRIEIAASTRRDQRTRTARVIARAALIDPAIAQAVYGCAEVQGLVDLLLREPESPNEPEPETMLWLVCADLSRRSARYGLSVDPFPNHYQ